MREKLNYMSLEYIIGENTYWLTKDAVHFYFAIIPKSFFGDWNLVPNAIRLDQPFSEIFVYSDGATLGNVNEEDQAIEIKLPKWDSIEWNELARLVEDPTPFYHLNLVKKKESSSYPLSDEAYRVMAFSPDYNKFTLAGEGCVTIDGTLQNFMDNFAVVGVNMNNVFYEVY